MQGVNANGSVICYEVLVPPRITTVDDDPDNNVGFNTSIAIGTDGFPVISYLEVSSSTGAGSLKVAKCNDAACSGNNRTITTVDLSAASDGESSQTSIAIGTDGFPGDQLHQLLHRLLHGRQVQRRRLFRQQRDDHHR